MIKGADIPKGYKQTKIGVIPEDWEATPFKSVSLSSAFGPRFSSDLYSKEGNIATLRTTDMDLDGNLDFSNMPLAELSIEDIKSHILQKNDLVVSRSGTIGVTAVFNSFHIPVIPGAFLIRFRLNPLKIESEYLKSYFNSTKGKRRILNIAGGGVQKNLSGTSLLNLIIPIPPLPEQQKIAEILTTWDKSISTTQGIIDELKLRNKGLAQQLLTGKKRLNGFDGEWKYEHLEHFFTERKETGYVDLPLLSVGESGVYPQSDSNKKDTSNSDKAKYKRICVGDIGYNTMRMWQGRSALSQLEGIVSPAYTIVCPKKNADNQFFAFLFKLDEVVHKFFRNSQGLVSDTLNCKFKDFKIVKVNTPPTVEEQQAIANVLLEADQEVAIYEKKLATLKEQKKGLMQKLLTGQIRVNTDKTN